MVPSSLHRRRNDSVQFEKKSHRRRYAPPTHARGSERTHSKAAAVFCCLGAAEAAAVEQAPEVERWRHNVLRTAPQPLSARVLECGARPLSVLSCLTTLRRAGPRFDQRDHDCPGCERAEYSKHFGTRHRRSTPGQPALISKFLSCCLVIPEPPAVRLHEVCTWCRHSWSSSRSGHAHR